ncbi:MAG: hypothetical protein CM1200mP36_11610 [Gammaproteobacteria bacterium]|nr:MAG: hypothetical protein CM1200mP36_11610 [Gammaproteobacteria bacterium]
MRSTDEGANQFAENQEIPFTPGTGRSIFGTWIRPGMFGDASGSGTRTGEDSITPLVRRRAARSIPSKTTPSFTASRGALSKLGTPGSCNIHPPDGR